jgi:hypothetical protein
MASPSSITIDAARVAALPAATRAVTLRKVSLEDLLRGPAARVEQHMASLGMERPTDGVLDVEAFAARFLTAAEQVTAAKAAKAAKPKPVDKRSTRSGGDSTPAPNTTPAPTHPTHNPRSTLEDRLLDEAIGQALEEVSVSRTGSLPPTRSLAGQLGAPPAATMSTTLDDPREQADPASSDVQPQPSLGTPAATPTSTHTPPPAATPYGVDLATLAVLLRDLLQQQGSQPAPSPAPARIQSALRYARPTNEEAAAMAAAEADVTFIPPADVDAIPRNARKRQREEATNPILPPAPTPAPVPASTARPATVTAALLTPATTVAAGPAFNTPANPTANSGPAQTTVRAMSHTPCSPCTLKHTPLHAHA